MWNGNKHINERLNGILTILNGVHQASSTMSNASKGTDREAFIDNFLSAVLPPHYRFGTGDATDAFGSKTGQLDVVVELPFAPSLPLTANTDSRLYIAEGVAAVIEVKSDVANQWEEVISTAKKLKKLRRKLSPIVLANKMNLEDIPFFVVGYKGWKTRETIDQKISEVAPFVNGVLVLDPAIYVGHLPPNHTFAHGPRALWSFITHIHNAANNLQAASPDLGRYAFPVSSREKR